MFGGERGQIMAHTEEKSVALFWAKVRFRCLLDIQRVRLGGGEIRLKCKGDIWARDKAP